MPSTSSPGVEVIPPGARSAEEELARLEWLAQLLDSRFMVPGTNIRFGVDGLIGLIPGVGDVVSGLISLYLITRASYLGLSPWVKARMVWNVVLDTAIGAIPFLGDIFDVSFKSNVRNIALAREALNRRR
ncbi:MAG TPA: DUF4112 domain-containing protein [Rhizomicrobium sp.]|jgi:hypothetical protein|nr:DUF4112 domain-containing protein [Rhizomicrobium sp.]